MAYLRLSDLFYGAGSCFAVAGGRLGGNAASFKYPGAPDGAGRSDVFDILSEDADHLRIGVGSDVYWLGAGTGRDVIRERFWERFFRSGDDRGDADGCDKTEIKKAHAAADVRFCGVQAKEVI